ncbi:MAG: PKD domain-containing protein [Candidatus Aenigmatarchaeota archaeon]
MKGDMSSWFVSLPFLVFVGIFVIGIAAGFYIRTLAAGPPIQVTTYGKYMWLNDFPSNALFFIAKPEGSRDALEEIALYDEGGVYLNRRTEFIGRYSGMEDFSGIEFGPLDRALSNLEGGLNEESSVKRELYMLKDSHGLVIVYGMDRLFDGLTKDQSLISSRVPATFPGEYPYECSQKVMPVFSEGYENTRVLLVLCCLDIKSCADYPTAAGRDECSEDDPCAVGPCRIDYDAPGGRACTENVPPRIDCSVRLEGEDLWQSGERVVLSKDEDAEGYTVKFNIIASDEDSTLKRIGLEFGEGTPVSSNKLEGLAQATGGTDYPIHKYEKPGTYTVTCKAWDERQNPVKKEITLVLE